MMTGPGGATLGNRIAPARFLLFLALLVGGFAVRQAILPDGDWRDGAVVAFDAAAAVFLLSLTALFRDSDPDAIRRDAARNDANRILVLVLTALLTLVVMAALTGELPRAMDGEALAIGKLVATLLLIWLFANSVFALHYAHVFYLPDTAGSGDAGGIDFPGAKAPDYWDFAYFAFTLGMTYQTSDATICTRAIRKVALFHGLVAFVFSIGVVAFAINVIGGAS